MQPHNSVESRRHISPQARSGQPSIITFGLMHSVFGKALQRGGSGAALVKRQYLRYVQKWQSSDFFFVWQHTGKEYHDPKW